MKKILVTGGRGFLGRVVVSELKAHPQSAGDTIETFSSSEFDLRDPQAAAELLKQKKPDIVVHLAAKVGGIGANREFPGTLFYDNLVMGAHLIEACRHVEIDHFLLAGTVCSYPKFCSIPFREEELWNGYPEETNAPYGIAKKALLVQLSAYREQFGFPSTSLLIVNLYGPGDNFDLNSSHVVPAMLRRFHEARESNSPSVTLWGDGSASREFLYVADAARAIRLALQDGRTPGPINIGSGEEISMKNLAALIQEIVDYQGTIVWDSAKPNGQPRRCLETGKAEQLIGFKASTSLRDGLEQTYQWFKDNCSEISAAELQDSGELEKIRAVSGAR